MIPSSFFEKCVLHLQQNANLAVSGSIPIPYFGDLRAYKNSILKVVTVGLNPSDVEFSETRFNISRALNNAQSLEQELNAYFNVNPYRDWFESFDVVLSGLDASYYVGSKQNVVLHCDLCSPIATAEKWSLLKRRDSAALLTFGVPLFRELIGYLRPHIAIFSVNAPAMNALFPDQSLHDWTVLCQYERRKTGETMKRPLVIRIARGHVADVSLTLAHGPSFNKPFGAFSTERKREVGSKILAWHRQIGDAMQ